MNIMVGEHAEFVATLAADVSAGDLVVPSLPEVTLRIRNLLDDPNVSLDRVMKALATEPVLAAYVLKLANSALYRQSGAAETNLARAIARVGFAVVRSAAIMFGMKQLVHARAVAPYRPFLQRIWQHSVEVSALSRAIAGQVGSANVEAATLGGLLHDIGKFYVVMRAKDHPTLFAEEETLVAIAQEWHTGIGRALLESWGLPEVLQTVVDEHELLDRDPGRLLPDLTDIVVVANRASHFPAGDAEVEDPLLQASPSWQRLQLDFARLALCRAQAEQQARDLEGALGD